MKNLIHSYINEEAEFTGVESPWPLFFGKHEVKICPIDEGGFYGIIPVNMLEKLIFIQSKKIQKTLRKYLKIVIVKNMYCNYVVQVCAHFSIKYVMLPIQ